MLQVFDSLPSKGGEIDHELALLSNDSEVKVVSWSPSHFDLAGKCRRANQDYSSLGPRVAKVEQRGTLGWRERTARHDVVPIENRSAS